LMPRKKSVRSAAEKFIERSDALSDYYVNAVAARLSAQEATWAVEAAIIKLSVYFEHLMLEALVGAINNDTTTVSSSVGIPFPKHLTDEICEYLVTGGGYFDFRGRDGLIKLLRRFVPEDHYLLQAVSRQKYRIALERVVALRNLAAHESRKGKAAARLAVNGNVASAGAWLKRAGRFNDINARLKELAEEIRDAAPY
jgi:hypothetical protein